MLLDKKEVLEILRCPKTGSRLQKTANKLVAESETQHIEWLSCTYGGSYCLFE